jgi:Na+/H+ antiporter NhaC
LLVIAGASVLSQETDSVPATEGSSLDAQAPDSPGESPPAKTSTTAEDESAPAMTTPQDRYGWFALVPAVVAIVLTLLTRQVVPALAIGVIVGAFMLLPSPEASGGYGAWTLAGFKSAAENYTMGAILDPGEGFEKSPITAIFDSGGGFGHLKIIIFTLTIGFMVGVMGRNGGTAGMVEVVAGRSKSQRRTALTAWLAGMVVFFDDYANSMIVGPTMRSVFDRVKLSRAKLAYIVDSTAAPVASLALIGTWVGFEIGSISQGLDTIHAAPAGQYAFLAGETGMTVFIQSLCYRFYPVFALVLVFLIALTGRDFGPMRKSEARALATLDDAPSSHGGAETETAKPNAWLGLLPVLCLVGVTLYVLWHIGWHNDETVKLVAGEQLVNGKTWLDLPWYDQAGIVISNSDSYIPIFYAAFAASALALVLSSIARSCSLRDAADAGLEGMSRMFPAIVILVLAWALSSVEQNLHLGDVVADRLKTADFDPRWMPLLVFISAAGISFATGTSWGTMGILCPVTVEVTAKLVAGMDPAAASPLFFAAVGSVLAGAVFGDHCSPISDTTVLSSTASGCRHEEHVWTQMPYALAAAVVSMGLGDVLCSEYKQPWYYGMGAGTGALVLIVLIFGRKPTPPPPTSV